MYDFMRYRPTMPNSPRQPELMLTPKQVGQRIGRHQVVVIRYIAEGKFPNAIVDGERNGRRYRIPEGDVTRYLEAHRVAA